MLICLVLVQHGLEVCRIDKISFQLSTHPVHSGLFLKRTESYIILMHGKALLQGICANKSISDTTLIKYDLTQDLGNDASLTLEGWRLSKPKLVTWPLCRVRRKRTAHQKVFLLCCFNHLSETTLGCLHLSIREPRILP